MVPDWREGDSARVVPFPCHISLIQLPLQVSENLCSTAWFSFLGALAQFHHLVKRPMPAVSSCRPQFQCRRGPGPILLWYRKSWDLPSASCVMQFERSQESAWLSLGLRPHLFPENSAGGKEQLLQDARATHMSRN